MLFAFTDQTKIQQHDTAIAIDQRVSWMARMSGAWALPVTAPEGRVKR